jgi:ligand-binding sensor domain-containing protein
VAGADTVLVEADSGWQQLDLTGESLHSAALVNGWVWTGGLRGILRKDGDRWRRYSELNGVLPDSWVTALEPVGGEVWVGTYDAGLLAINRAGQARVLRTGEWINPNAITPVPDGVAVGTQGDGLLLWDQLRRRWHRLTTADGLPSDNVTAILAVGDTLWVGARQGLARIDRSAPPSEGGIAR